MQIVIGASFTYEHVRRRSTSGAVSVIAGEVNARFQNDRRAS